MGGRAEEVAARGARINLQGGPYDVWHDRAVFHFLTAPGQRRAYVDQAPDAVKPGGLAIIGAFGPEGPVKCSGLDTVRYDLDSLQAELGPQFRLIESATELHHTPLGAAQEFLYCCFILK